MTLLAGPILRRATPNRVCVWFATRQPVDLELQVITKDNEVLGSSIKNDFCQLGKNLYVYLLQARSDSNKGFPTDKQNTFLYYRLLDKSTGDFLKLSEWGLTYGDDPQPKFFIPGKLKQILHGSCRKPHGGGDSPDALSYGDRLLKETHDSLAKRPAVLLLTGDQIYADDVSVAVLDMLKEQATTLIGRPELLPLNDEDEKTTYQDPHTIALQGRKDFLKNNNSGFTSGESENHLLSFGEFSAMYIYVFGNAENWQPINNWEKLASQFASDVEEDKKIRDAQTAVNNFQTTLPDVRRLLANVPTYMILDDHDVTDDWNITNAWYDSVSDSPLGRRIVSNALASYWAFQGWGNDPDNFDKDLQLTIGQYLLDTTNSQAIYNRYDVHLWGHRGWGFSVPTTPPIIAIDSRTQRMPTTNSHLPVLLDRYALYWLQVEWAKLKTDPNISISAESSPIFIATTPVLGFSVVERLQKAAYWIIELFESNQYVNYLEKILGMEGYLTEKIIDLADMEAWTSNKQSFLNLMNCLSQKMQIQQCVFLSGDVHYAFTALGTYKRDSKAAPMYCYQFVSSSLKNSPDDEQGKGLEKASKFGNGSTKHTVLLKELFPWLPIDTWENWVHLLKPESEKSRVFRECNLGLVKFDANGMPTHHTLLADRQIEYSLPDCKTFTFEEQHQTQNTKDVDS